MDLDELLGVRRGPDELLGVRRGPPELEPASEPESDLDLGLYTGGKDQWFITYELGLDSSDEDSCPQVTRVYLSGDLRKWELGVFETRSGAKVQGVKIEYERTHESYRSRDDETECETSCTHCFAKIVEVPHGAAQIKLRSALPDRYRHALHRF